jgi:hypothetical protein
VDISPSISGALKRENLLQKTSVQIQVILLGFADRSNPSIAFPFFERRNSQKNGTFLLADFTPSKFVQKEHTVPSIGGAYPRTGTKF